MREGAWIEMNSGRYVWIDEHASWMQRYGREFGLPVEVWQAIRLIPNDFAGEGRERILLAVMHCGYIRMRAHGVQVSFEFTCSIEEALRACQPVLAAIAGPQLLCHFVDLNERQFLQVEYRDFAELLASGQQYVQQRIEPLPEGSGYK
jgi:hypothetical protein